MTAPIGIKPSYVWKHQRIEELLAAIERYSYAGIYGPIARWAEEITQLSRDIEKEMKP